MPALGARSDPRLQEDALDGMRGIAAMLVVGSHLSLVGMFPIPGLDLAGIGKPGVYLFFVLSAFLLTRQFLSRDPAALADRSLWLRYFARRFLRIFPLFGFVLVTSWAVGRFAGLSLPFAIDGEELFAHLTLRAGKGVLWSIPPEFEYYFVLPGVAVAFLWLRRSLASVLAGCALAIAACMHAWPPSLAVSNAAYLGPYLPVFLLGSVAALVHGRLAPTAGQRRRRVLYEALALSCAALVVLTVPSLYAALSGHAVPSDRFHGSLLFYGVVWSAFLVSTLLGSGWCRAACSGRALRYLGFVSFSTYLWHVAVIRVVRNLSTLPPLANAWLALGLVLLVASASYFAIERPFLALARGPARSG